MIIKSLEELRQADSRTLRFTPNGLSLGGELRPEDAAEYQQQVAAQLELASVVADSTRRSFEHLRTVFAYGVLCYEIYTLIDDHALLVIEQALRDRFVDYHGGVVTFVDKLGVDRQIDATRYEQVIDFVSGGQHKGWRLRTDPNQTMAFNGMLHGLRTWARSVGLLRGQRNRGIEKALVQLRNFVAHPGGYHLNGPVEAVRTLSDVAEIINQLWGQPTVDGRLYPAPIHRDIVLLSWTQDSTTGVQIMPAEALAHLDHDLERQNIIVRAVHHPGVGRHDPDLLHFDAQHEVTRYPVDLLWGPGTSADAATWYAAHQPEPDTTDYLDQTFVVRVDDSTLFLPMRPTVAAMLPATEQSGTWYAVRADRGNDAWLHVQNLINGACTTDGPCQNCSADTIHSGSLADVLAEVIDPATSIAPLPPDITTPWAHPRFRPV